VASESGRNLNIQQLDATRPNSRNVLLWLVPTLLVWSEPSPPARAASARMIPADASRSRSTGKPRPKGPEGMRAVASVVLNRVAHPQFPDTVCAVVTEGGEQPPCQFSWWCDGKSDRPTEARAWRLARQIAHAALTDPPRDRTGGALFFHDAAIATPWLGKRERTVQIGRHIYPRSCASAATHAHPAEPRPSLARSDCARYSAKHGCFASGAGYRALLEAPHSTVAMAFKGKLGMQAIHTVIGTLLLSVAICATAPAQERDLLDVRQHEDELGLRSPLAADIDRQLRTSRDIEHELSLEQSRVNARSASALQHRQTSRDVQLSEQRLNTLKTGEPRARSIPLLERRLDRVQRPTGAISRNPGLESGASTSLGLSGSIGGF
jgi:N-acetylmuramoyl-L-alanine amidase